MLPLALLCYAALFCACVGRLSLLEYKRSTKVDIPDLFHLGRSYRIFPGLGLDKLIPTAGADALRLRVALWYVHRPTPEFWFGSPARSEVPYVIGPA